jgi:hypothetical protein
MKIAIALIFLAVVLGAQSAPKYFDFNGLTGLLDTSHSVNGVESAQLDPKAASKAEEIIKAMIHKHLDKKKASKKVAKKAQKPEETSPPEPAAQPAEIPEYLKNINWDSHPEERNRINEKVPGGTEAIDALVRLIQERRGEQ